jgi:hypothetical protein
VGRIKISFTLTCDGESTAYKIAFAMSSACNASIFFAFSTNPFNDSSVIVSLSSVATTPGSILVTLMLERALNSCLNPSVNAATANLVAQ